MSKQTIVQPGTSHPRDLFLFCHIAGDYIRDEAAHATRDAVIAELWGEGTSAYKPLLATYGGFRGWVKQVETKLSTAVRRVCLTTWSAGSQVAKDVCAGGMMFNASTYAGLDYAKLPDAIVMTDGLYAVKPEGSKPGDGQVVMDEGLTALAWYAVAAAKGERVMVLMHSAIPTPYASSAECCAAVRKFVEGKLGLPFEPIAFSEGVGLRDAVQVGTLTILGFGGADGAEHVREAHLFDEVWKRFIPWAAGVDEEPKADRVTAPDPTIPERAVTMSLVLAENRAGVSAQVWAGVTRLVGVREVPLKVGNPAWAWCAAAFQFESYDAASALGFGRDAVDDWRTGPIPHGRRVSVVELQNDFKTRGLFHPAADVPGGVFEPARGDAVFLDRGKGAGFGHVCRFVRRVDGDTFETVGGNEAGTKPGDTADRWRLTVRRFDDARLRGYGAFPRAGAPETVTPIDMPATDLAEHDKALLDATPALP